MVRFIPNVLFLLSVLLMSCGHDDTPSALYDESEMQVESATDVYIIQSDSARVQLTIKSPRLRKYEENHIVTEEFSEGFELTLYNNQQKITSSISAQYALRKSAKGILILKDSVTYINERGDKLETNALSINETEGTISSTKFFRLIRPIDGDTIYGRGFTARDDFSKLEVTKYHGKGQGVALDLR